MHARTALALATLALSSGCQNNPPAPAPAPVTMARTGAQSPRLAPAPTRPPALAIAPTLAPPPAQVGPLLVGMDDTEPPSAAAVSANTRGFSYHRAARYAEATREFAAAFAASPGFLLARYNYACALARQGLLDDAARSLEYVLARDLLDVRSRALADPDLAPLWADPRGVAVRARITELEPLYRQAALHGVRALLWVDVSGELAPRAVRVGVYEPASRRFVPLAPAAASPLAAFTTADAPFATVASGPTSACQGPGCPALEWLSVWLYAMDGSGALLSQFRAPAAGRSSLANVLLEPDTDAVELAYTTAEDSARRYVRVGTRGTPQTHPRAPDGPTAFGSLALLSPGGSRVHERAAGYDFSGRALHLAGNVRVALPAPPGTIDAGDVALSPDRSAAVVALSLGGCDCNAQRFEARPTHELLRVELATRAVTRLAGGAGVGAARFDPTGRLYLQEDRTLSLVNPDGTLAPTMPHLVLVPPLSAHWGGCCEV